MVLTAAQIDPKAWKRLTLTSQTGTWFQSPEAYTFFASLPEIMDPFAVVVGTQDHSLRAICVGYVTKEHNPVRQHFTRRAIIIGGPCIADDCTDHEVAELMQAVRANLHNKAIYIETRNFNDYSRWKSAFESAGFSYRPHLNFHVDCTDNAAILARLSDNRKRQLKKAKASAVTVVEAKDEDEVRSWYRILANLYRTKVKTPLFPVEFFVEAFRQRVGTFLLIIYNDTIIGGSMLAVLDGKCVYEWYECGLNAEYKEQYPSVTATCAGMNYAAEQGIQRYDMMGAGEPEIPYGVRDFKAEFGGVLVEHGRFLYICKPLLFRLGTLGVRLLKGHK
jgi:hypothetical protein